MFPGNQGATFGRRKWRGSHDWSRRSVWVAARAPCSASAGSPLLQFLWILARSVNNSMTKCTSSFAGLLHHRSLRKGIKAQCGTYRSLLFSQVPVLSCAPRGSTSHPSSPPEASPACWLQTRVLTRGTTDCTDCLTSFHNHVHSNPYNKLLVSLKVVLLLQSNFNWYRFWNQSEGCCNKNLKHMHWLWDWPWKVCQQRLK